MRINQIKKTVSFRFHFSLATELNENSTSNVFNHSDNAEQSRVYNQAVVLNSLIRNMVKNQEQRGNVSSSPSNESCLTNESQVNQCF